MSASILSGSTASRRNLPSASAVTPWVRNPLWASLPSVTVSDQKFAGLYAVYPDAPFIALSATTSSGTYTVNWGDGTSEEVSSGTTAYHTYDYSDADLTSTSLPYKQAVVVVTPTTANLLTVDLNIKHSTSGLQTYSSGWLDIVASLPNASTGKPLTISASTQNVFMCALECVSIKTLGAHTDTSYMFSGCNSLQSVPLFDTSSVTSMNYMFNGCYSLQSVPLFNTSAVSNTSYMFNGCYSLQSVPLFNTSAVSNTSYMFYNCSSLQSVPALNMVAVTSMSHMFNGCYSLQSVPLFDTSSVTSTSYMFNNCRSLQSVPLFDTSSVTSMNSMFSGCNSLQSVPALNMVAVTSMSNMFSGCYSLSNIDAYNFRVTFSVVSCKLSGDRLNEIYGNLGTGLTGKVITVTGNYGTASDNPALVPSGWTVTG